jgi:hypothetical protein
MWTRGGINAGNTLGYWFERHREDLICLGILALTAFGTLVPVIVLDRAPVDTRALANFPPWESAFDDRAPEIHLSPVLAYDLPNYRFIANENLKDRGLLWNPLEYGGMPFFAAWRTRCLSPFTAPFYKFSFETALKLSLLLKLSVAGCVAFVAARRLGLTAPFSLMAALAFQLGAHFSIYPLAPATDVLVWFPFFFVFLERLSLGHLAHWATGGATIALMVLGGSPETLAGILLLGFVYLAVRLYLRRDRIRPMPSLLTYGATVAFALALTAIQLLPFIEFRASVNLMKPLLDDPPLAVVHLGLINVLVAGVWLAMRQHISTMPRRRIDCTMLVSVVMVAFVVLTLPLLKQIPEWLQVEAHHLTGGIIFILSIGAAAAAEAWLELNPNQCRAALKRLALLIPFAIVPVVFLALLPMGSRETWFPETGRMIFAGILGGVFAAILAITLFRPSVRLMGYGLAAVGALELLVSFYPYRQYSPMESVFPETRTISELREAGLVSGGPVLSKWPLAGNGIRQVYGTGPYVPESYLEWQSTADLSSIGAAPSPMLFFGAQGFNDRFTRARHKLQLAQVYPEGVARYRFEDAPAEIEFAPKASANGSGIANDRGPTLRVLENYHAKLKVATSSPGGETLTVWKTQFPGWVAEVDGMPAGFRTIHGPYRSIALPPGDHVATIRYRPLYFTTGAVISGLAVIVLGFGYLRLWRQRVALRRSAASLI